MNAPPGRQRLVLRPIGRGRVYESWLGIGVTQALPHSRFRGVRKRPARTTLRSGAVFGGASDVPAIRLRCHWAPLSNTAPSDELGPKSPTSTPAAVRVRAHSRVPKAHRAKTLRTD